MTDTEAVTGTTVPAIDIEGAIAAEGGASFGLIHGTALDPRSHYATLPRTSLSSGDGDGTTGSSRAFSFDVSNNAVVANVDEYGFIRRMATSEDLIPVYETGLPGVFVNKDFDSVECRIGLDISARQAGEERYTPVANLEAADLIDNLLPRSISRSEGVSVSRVTFAPMGSARRPRGVITIVHIVNVGLDEANVRVQMVAHAEVVAGSALPSVRLFAVDGAESDQDYRAGVDLVVPARQSVRLVTGTVLTRGNDDDDWSALTALTPEAQLERTIQERRQAYGRLVFDGAPYYSDLLERSAELARQVSLLGPDGRLAGSFWGSDANDRPDVWMLDLFYSALPMAQLAPDLCRATIDFFVRYGLPPAAWGNYSAADEGHPLEGVEPVSHSIVNATAALALAGAHVEANGDCSTFTGDPAFVEYAVRVLGLLFASRQEGEVLFPSVFISDGPARGDFHTGSNIKAWYAIRSMADIFASAPEHRERAGAWQYEAERVWAAIKEQCCGLSPIGMEYFEGVDRDGTHVLGHDGEETDLTLASVYGFTDIDDPGIINHAKNAFSRRNPYYVPATGGVSWWDFRFHGPTFPAFIHALAAADTEAALIPPLEAVRLRADLDGSIWWWPHLHEETDPAHVLRGPGKCGWAAGAFVTKFVHDVIGIQVDAPTRRVRFAPFSPWSFTWNGARLGAVSLDLDYRDSGASREVSVRNRCDRPLDVELELLLPKGAAFSSATLDGEDALELVRAHTRFSRTAVRVSTSLAPGRSGSFRVGVVAA